MGKPDNEIKELLDEKEENEPKRYKRFEEYGDDFIQVMDSGIPEIDSKWASADEIFEASDADKRSFNENTGHRRFTTIYNLMCDIGLLTAFHNSPAYDIDTEEYETQPLIDAWEYVSGEEYAEDMEETEPNLGAPELNTDNLYEELRD